MNNHFTVASTVLAAVLAATTSLPQTHASSTDELKSSARKADTPKTRRARATDTSETPAVGDRVAAGAPMTVSAPKVVDRIAFRNLREATRSDPSRPGGGGESVGRPRTKASGPPSWALSGEPSPDRFSGGAAQSGQTPPPTVAWMADVGAKGGYPSDSQVAVSRTHVVVTNRQKLAFFDKAGNQLDAMSSRSFFAPLGLDQRFQITQYNDLRTIFDGYRNRFWIVADSQPVARDQDRKEWHPFITAAVSISENPLDGWIYYYWNAVPQWGQEGSDVWEAGMAPDYPCLGIGPKCIYEVHAVDAMPGSDKKKLRMVSFFDADSLAGGQFRDGWSYWHLTNPDGSRAGFLQPTVHHGEIDRAYFASRGGNPDEAVIWALTDPLGANQKLERVAVQLKNWQRAQDAPQKDSDKKIKMTNMGTAVLKSVYRKGLLHFVTNDSRDWLGDGELMTSIRLVRLPVLDFPKIDTGDADFIDRTFGKNNLFDDEKDECFYYGWPAIEVNEDLDMAIGYARSGTTIHPEMRATVYYDADTDVSSSRQLKAGETKYEVRGREVAHWADLGGASVDPYDDEGIWLAQQYASNGGSGYDIWVAKMFGRTVADWRVLEIDFLSVPRRTWAGNFFPVEIRIGNGGDGPAVDRCVVQVRSVQPDGNRVDLLTFVQRALLPGESERHRVDLTLPRWARGGEHRLEVVLSPVGDKEEYSFENNVALSEETIMVLGRR